MLSKMKQKNKGIVPKKLRALAKEASWGKSANRQTMIKTMTQSRFKQIYKERAYRVEPMQGLVKEIFDFDQCWMKDTENSRWLFAAMGLTIQMHQLKAYREKR